MKKITAVFLSAVLSLSAVMPVFAQKENPTDEEVIELAEKTSNTSEYSETEESFKTQESSTSEEDLEKDEVSETEETPPPAEELMPVSVTMAINDSRVIVNGNSIESAAPILAFDRTYVDLFAVAPILGIEVLWVEDSGGYFQVSANGQSINFTLLAKWDDLASQSHKYFVKDSRSFVSARELADFIECGITYDRGIVTFGERNDTDIYQGLNIYVYDDYLYAAYPYWPEHIVNPFVTNTYEDMLGNAQKLQQMHPDLIKISSIGKSVENRDLLLIEFGRGPIKIFVCGTHHAREYMATTYLMNVIDKYAYAYRTNSMWGNYNPKEILNKVTFCIVPMVNPDGVNLVQHGIYATEHADSLSKMGIYDGSKYGYSAWKANINGVDVNWNYDKDWSIKRNKNPRGSIGFNGDYPNSEPETAAVANYVDNHMFDAYLSFHTQGQIFYWADDPVNPMYLHKAIQRDTGFTGSRDSGTGVGGSFFDYVYRKFQKPTITVELCPYVGKYPYPDNDFVTVWEPAKNILFVAANELIYRKSL